MLKSSLKNIASFILSLGVIVVFGLVCKLMYLCFGIGWRFIK
jgi:hypothetical protein